jgi:hypothetical protein
MMKVDETLKARVEESACLNIHWVNNKVALTFVGQDAVDLERAIDALTNRKNRNNSLTSIKYLSTNDSRTRTKNEHREQSSFSVVRRCTSSAPGEKQDYRKSDNCLIRLKADPTCSIVL